MQINAVYFSYTRGTYNDLEFIKISLRVNFFWYSLLFCFCFCFLFSKEITLMKFLGLDHYDKHSNFEVYFELHRFRNGMAPAWKNKCSQMSKWKLNHKLYYINQTKQISLNTVNQANIISIIWTGHCVWLNQKVIISRNWKLEENFRVYKGELIYEC